MRQVSLHYLPGDRHAAERLGRHLGISVFAISVHTFPDKENRIRVHPVKGTVILYATLNAPNEKLLYLAFAASALREAGAKRLVLVAPYLCYMRQDKAFQAGEAVSQRVIAGFLSAYFDRVLTVDPHLHRIDDLQSIFTNCKADVLSATGLIAGILSAETAADRRLLVGPDSEAKQWVQAIATKLMIPFIIGEKIRTNDRQVAVTLPKDKNIHGTRVIIVDDVISSGATICRCAEALLQAGAQEIEVVAVHILCSDGDITAMKEAGVSRIRSTDSIPHPTNAIRLGPLLAEALMEEK